MPTYDELINRAILIIQEHNENGAGLDVELIVTNLKKLSGGSFGALRGASFEQLEECGLPRFTARQVALEALRRDKRRAG